MNVSTSRDRLWQKRLKDLSDVWPEFVSGRNTGLHKTRVASRRIREALPIVGVAAPPAKVKKLSKKMRALTRYLGPIRELDVELDLLETRAKTAGTSARAIEMVRREVAARRQALREKLADDAPVDDLRKLLKKLDRIAAKGSRTKQGKAEAKFDAQWRGVLATRLMRRAKVLGAAIEDAGALYTPERLHDVRIGTKKLRYTLEIARDAGITAAASLLRTMKRQQDRLGRLHDLQMLLKHVRETETMPGIVSRVSDLSAYADSLDRECRRLHADFVEHRSELIAVVKDVRHHIVPALTTPPRRQARVAAEQGTADRPRARAK